MAVTFGLFDWVDWRKVPLGRLYEERLTLLEAADAAGFFCYHLAEHHATPLGMTPSPSVFLAAAAQRTRRIRLGPLVYLLPLYSPLRLLATGTSKPPSVSIRDSGFARRPAGSVRACGTNCGSTGSDSLGSPYT